MASAQDPQITDDFPLSIPIPESSGKCCITAIERTRPLEEGDTALSSSPDKKPAPEEPETAHSVSCVDKKPVPEEGESVRSVSSLIKSPAPEENGTVFSVVRSPAPEENGTVFSLLKSHTPEETESASLALNKSPAPEENGTVFSVVRSPAPEENGTVFSLLKCPAPEENGTVFSMLKCPTPEENGTVFSVVRSPAPEENGTVFSLLKSHTPEETESASLALNKSPAPEEQSAHVLKHTLKEEQDQNPLREETKGTNHRTGKEDSANNTVNPTDVTLANIEAHLDVIGQFIRLIPCFLRSVGCVVFYIAILALQTLVLSLLLSALRQIKKNGKLVFVAVIFLCIGRISSAVGCYEGWFIGKNLSSQTLVIRNHSYTCTFFCGLSFPFTHRCPPLTVHMENVSALRLRSENWAEYRVEYGDGPNGKSGAIQMKECAEFLAPDPQASLFTPGRNHFAVIGAGSVVLAVVILILYKLFVSWAAASSPNNCNGSRIKKGQSVENLKATTKENTTSVTNGSSVKSFSKGTGSIC